MGPGEPLPPSQVAAAQLAPCPSSLLPSGLALLFFRRATESRQAAQQLRSSLHAPLGGRRAEQGGQALRRPLPWPWPSRQITPSPFTKEGSSSGPRKRTAIHGAPLKEVAPAEGGGGRRTWATGGGEDQPQYRRCQTPHGIFNHCWCFALRWPTSDAYWTELRLLPNMDCQDSASETPDRSGDGETPTSATTACRGWEARSGMNNVHGQLRKRTPSGDRVFGGGWGGGSGGHQGAQHGRTAFFKGGGRQVPPRRLPPDLSSDREASSESGEAASECRKFTHGLPMVSVAT